MDKDKPATKAPIAIGILRKNFERKINPKHTESANRNKIFLSFAANLNRIGNTYFARKTVSNNKNRPENANLARNA